MRALTDLEFEILKILADNSGHALWELAKLFGKEKSNLIIVLNRLEEEIELTDLSRIRYYDIINSDSLCLKFREPSDALSQYICEKFSENTIRCLSDPMPNFCLGIIELDELLDDPHLYNESRFSHVALSENARSIMNSKLDGRDLRCFNRMLLEEAYPEFILKGKDSLICKGASRKTTNPNSRQPKHHETPYFINSNPLVLRFLVMTLNIAIEKTNEIINKNCLAKLKELEDKLRWRHISRYEYDEIRFKIECDNYDDRQLRDIQEKVKLLDDFLSTQYVLQFVKKYGFKWTVYRIHSMLDSWDQCWALGRKAIDSDALRDEDELECAEKLIRYHQSAEEGFRQLEQETIEIEDDDMNDVL